MLSVPFAVVSQLHNNNKACVFTHNGKKSMIGRSVQKESKRVVVDAGWGMWAIPRRGLWDDPRMKAVSCATVRSVPMRPLVVLSLASSMHRCRLGCVRAIAQEEK